MPEQLTSCEVRRLNKAADGHGWPLRRWRWLAVMASLAVLLWTGAAPGATVLFSRLDSLEGWTVHAMGLGRVGVVPGMSDMPCLELQSDRGTLLVSRELPVADLAGSRVNVSCLVKTDQIQHGPQASSTAKVHLAIQTPQGVLHFSTRWTGSDPWRREGLVADVPPGAQRAVLNLGLEGCSGRLSLARLSLRNDRRGLWPLPLRNAVNAKLADLQCDLPRIPLTWQEILFQLVPASGSDDCLRLRGAGHEDWPASTPAIPVGRHVTDVYLLHGAVEGRAKSETPAAIWTAKTLAGTDVSLSLFEGRQLGAIGRTEDLENWKIAWRGQDSSGRTITFGVTRWPLYVDAVVESLTCRSYQGAPVVTLAVTLAEEPPAPQRPDDEDDEVSEGEQP